MSGCRYHPPCRPTVGSASAAMVRSSRAVPAPISSASVMVPAAFRVRSKAPSRVPEKRISPLPASTCALAVSVTSSLKVMSCVPPVAPTVLTLAPSVAGPEKVKLASLAATAVCAPEITIEPAAAERYCTGLAQAFAPTVSAPVAVVLPRRIVLQPAPSPASSAAE